MANTQTQVAHCGGCAGGMVLRPEDDQLRYICLACGYETPLRWTAAEAADDVVWAPLAAGRTAKTKFQLLNSRT
jgi:hypothetical protein